MKIENVISILGNTERTILENIEDIVNKSLSIDKVTNYYQEVKEASRDVVLGYVTFTNEVKNVSTDPNNQVINEVIFFMCIISIGNHTVFLVQFGINLQA